MLLSFSTSYRRLRVIGVLLAIVLLSSEGAAQGPVYGGLSAGYEFGLPLLFDRRPGIINRYGFDGAGISESRELWMGLYLGSPTFLSRDLGASFRFKYLVATSSYLSTMFLGDTVFDPMSSGGIVIPSYRLALDSRVQLVEAAFATSHHLPGGLTFEPGLWGSYRVRSQFTKVLRQQLDTGGGAEVDVEREEGEQLGAQAFRFGAAFTGGIQIPLFSRVLLRPELSLRFDATALGSVGLLQTLSPGAALSILFEIAPQSDDAPPLAPAADVIPLVDTVPERIPRLDARVDLFSVDESGERSQTSATRLVSVMWQQHMPFPGTIFFDGGSADIPARYTMLSSEQASGFSIDDLVDLEPRAVYLHALNLLGLRLREYPSASVTLVGAYAKDESSALGRLRAAAVRSYLLEIWGIDGARIGLRSSRVGNAVAGDESRSVRVETSGQIDDPVVIEWRTRNYAALAVDLEPEIEAEAGVRFWSVTMRQGERVITRYSSRDNMANAPLALHIPEYRENADAPPLVAELLVEDSTGARKIVADTLPLLRRQAATGSMWTEHNDSSLRRIYLVPWSDHKQWEGRNGRDWLHEIAKSCGANTRVTIGASSRYPCPLCEEMAARLRAATVAEVMVATIQYGTVPTLPVSAGSPEDRLVETFVRVDLENVAETGKNGRP